VSQFVLHGSQSEIQASFSTLLFKPPSNAKSDSRQECEFSYCAFLLPPTVQSQRIGRIFHLPKGYSHFEIDERTNWEHKRYDNLPNVQRLISCLLELEEIPVQVLHLIRRGINQPKLIFIFSAFTACNTPCVPLTSSERCSK
jgi:hypothetical protein